MNILTVSLSGHLPGSSAAARTSAGTSVDATSQGQDLFIPVPESHIGRPAEVFVGVPVFNLATPKPMSAGAAPSQLFTTAIRLDGENVGVSTDGRFLVVGPVAGDAGIRVDGAYHAQVCGSPSRSQLLFYENASSLSGAISINTPPGGVPQTIVGQSGESAMVTGSHDRISVEDASGHAYLMYPGDSLIGGAVFRGVPDVRDDSIIHCQGGAIVVEDLHPTVFTPTNDGWEIDGPNGHTSVAVKADGLHFHTNRPASNDGPAASADIDYLKL